MGALPILSLWEEYSQRWQIVYKLECGDVLLDFILIHRKEGKTINLTATITVNMLDFHL